MAINISESRAQLLEFLEKNKIGVIATVDSSGKPHAATVYVTFDQDLSLYFITRKGTRKSRNLQSNNQAALAIYNSASQTTLQAEGTVVEISSPPKMQWVFNDIWRIAAHTSPKNLPPQTQLIGADHYVVYKFSTPSLRLAVYTQQGSTESESIFKIIPTQGSEYINSYDKNID